MKTVKLGQHKELRGHFNFGSTMDEIARLQAAGIKFNQITLKSNLGYLSVRVVL